ncbi:hypothetical protein RRG08_023530 [Elysia crispata]|uniref:Uncharacterized protein n=1 Tax=Elysia crispata TaxID=231223 RepID=A0AAE1BEG4_9GAST|nr:hypothetical protein RRG08_023530 [Elysia crispata]
MTALKPSLWPGMEYRWELKIAHSWLDSYLLCCDLVRYTTIPRLNIVPQSNVAITYMGRKFYASAYVSMAHHTDRLTLSSKRLPIINMFPKRPADISPDNGQRPIGKDDHIKTIKSKFSREEGPLLIEMCLVSSRVRLSA